MPIRRFSLIALLLPLLCSTLCVAQGPKIRVLILAGNNNHDWKTTTPALEQVLDGAGRFDVTVCDDTAKLTPASLDHVDVILSNFNTFTTRTAAPKADHWSQAFRNAYIDFVRAGHGLVTVHAGSASFYDWPEYQQVALGTFKIGQTSHGKYHAFDVKITAPDHPITRGLSDFQTTDELWHSTAFQPGVTVIATAFSSKESGGSGKDEPVAVAANVGKGRSVFLVLGHDAGAIRNAGFGTLLARSVEWAATGQVSADAPKATTLQQALATMPQYKLADARPALDLIAHTVAATSRNAATRQATAEALAKALPTASPDGRHFLLQQLRLIASAEQIPALLPLLKNPDASMDVRGVLEAIPGDAASKALVDAVGSTTGAVQEGIVASLGVRRDASAVDAIAPLLKSNDPTVRRIAAWSLGQIATQPAGDALAQALGSATAANVRPIAEALLASSPREPKLTGANVPDDIRKRAFTAQMIEKPDSILPALQSDDRVRQAAALAAIRQRRDAALAGRASGRIDALAPDLQAELLTLLSERAADPYFPIFVKYAGSEDAVLRHLAIAGLAQLGSEKSADALVALADKAPQNEIDRLAGALARLTGPGIAARLAESLKRASTPGTIVIIRGLVARQDTSAVPALLKLTKSDDARVGAEAVRALGELAPLAACDDLIPLLDTRLEGQARSAIASICRRNGRNIDPVKRAYPGADAKRRIALLKTLAPTGGSGALALALQEAASADAAIRTEAIRALAVWSDGAPVEDLLSIAQKATQDIDRTLALRGLAKLVPNAGITRQHRLQILTEALKLTTDKQTRGMLEASLADVKKQPEQAPATGLRIVNEPAAVALLGGNTPVWRFDYNTLAGKPHFSALAPAGGPSIARVSPPDHIWHYGLWFSWKYLNKLNYWEEDRSHRSEGVNEWSNVRCESHPDLSATITLDLAYHPPGKPNILTEKRTMVISAPRADGSYTIDWTSAFTTGDVDVLFDRTPIPPEPGSQAWGGYAGLSLRMQQLTDHSIITEKGPVPFNNANRFRGPALAMDYSGTLDGKVIGVAMADHPSNIRHPSSWYAIRDRAMNFFNPALLIPGPLTVKAHDSFTLRYRVLVHPGKLTTTQLEHFATDFAKTR